MALDAAVLRVDIELDSPLDLGDSKIDVHGASCAVDHSGLPFDRHGPFPQCFGEEHLRMGLRGRTAVESVQALLESSAPRARRVTETLTGFDELGDGDQPTIEQLLEDRRVVERGEVDR